MNVVFWFLVLLALVALWFLLSGWFKPIGRFILKLFNGAKRDIEDDDNYEYTEERNDF